MSAENDPYVKWPTVWNCTVHDLFGACGWPELQAECSCETLSGAERILDALAAAGYHVVAEGQAVLADGPQAGQTVTVSYNEAGDYYGIYLGEPPPVVQVEEKQ